MSKDYYEILGVDKGADKEDIKKAYRELSKQHHPDLGGDEEKFKEINEAHSVLSDPEKRREYDNPVRHLGGFSFRDIFGGHGYQSSFHQSDVNAPRRGRNIVLEHMLPIHYFIFGGKFKIDLSYRDACPDCSGTGAEEKETCINCRGTGQVVESRQDGGMFIQSSRACPVCMGRSFTTKKQCESCNGSATRKIEKSVLLETLANTREGQMVGIVGEGHTGLNGGPPGDLAVKLFMKLPRAEDLTDEQKKVLEGI